MPSFELELTEASLLAQTALENVQREFPYFLVHGLDGPGDLDLPRALHPAFYGSYDWHSCVHQHWLLVWLLRHVPRLPQRDEAVDVLAETYTAENIAGEIAYFNRPHGRNFERPYGWAWLLTLDAELRGWDDPGARKWAEALRPLTDLIAERFVEWFEVAPYPNRVGQHGNSAFALSLGLDYGKATADDGVTAACSEAAMTWFSGDTDYAASFEPSTGDFLSPGLIEAELFTRLLDPGELADWLGRFLPRLEQGEPSALFTTPAVPDPTDAEVVHLQGLTVTRAESWKRIADRLPESDARRAIAAEAADRHATVGLSSFRDGDYMGSHWLGTFVLRLRTLYGNRASAGSPETP